MCRITMWNDCDEGRRGQERVCNDSVCLEKMVNSHKDNKQFKRKDVSELKTHFHRKTRASAIHMQTVHGNLHVSQPQT